jgi:1-phosphatidylinositol-4-phosphate 5-kinase
MGEFACLSGQVSEGKSGSFFYFSHDTRFMIKTIDKVELTTMHAIASDYYSHIINNPNTLLNRILGIYKMVHSGKEFFFVVLANVFNTDRKMHMRFDLKVLQ